MKYVDKIPENTARVVEYDRGSGPKIKPNLAVVPDVGGCRGPEGDFAVYLAVDPLDGRPPIRIVLADLGNAKWMAESVLAMLAAIEKKREENE